jgi:5-methylcytosine-specific restriction endonuclease McrA
MTYSEKLRSPLWQKKRLEIFERDGWTCKFCHSKDKNLQVHHIVYRKIDPWLYPNHLYQTVCEDCHPVRQELTDKIADAVRIAIKEVPTERLIKVAQSLCSAALLEIEVDQ